MFYIRIYFTYFYLQILPSTVYSLTEQTIYIGIAQKSVGPVFR